MFNWKKKSEDEMFSKLMEQASSIRENMSPEEKEKTEKHFEQRRDQEVIDLVKKLDLLEEKHYEAFREELEKCQASDNSWDAKKHMSKASDHLSKLSPIYAYAANTNKFSKEVMLGFVELNLEFHKLICSDRNKCTHMDKFKL